MREYIVPAITAATGIVAGWLAKRPTSLDKDSTSWTRMNDIVETLQEEMKLSKQERSSIHNDLEKAMERGVQLREDLLSTKIELMEVKALLHEAILRLKKNEIDIKGLEIIP